jgi:hypothetical protein
MSARIYSGASKKPHLLTSKASTAYHKLSFRYNKLFYAGHADFGNDKLVTITML